MSKKLRIVFGIIFMIIQISILSLYYADRFFNVSFSFDPFTVLFVFIISIFIQSFFNYKSWGIGNIITRCAFFFTLIADFFMTYLGKYYEISICFFIFVQLSYFILINYLYNKKYLNLMIKLYLIILGTLILIGLRLQLLNLLAVIAVIYISLSIINIIYLIILKRKDKFSIGFLIGLVLFLLCDISIGIMNLSTNNIVASFFDKIIWVFYGPSQIVLVNTLSHVNEMEILSYEESIKS